MKIKLQAFRVAGTIFRVADEMHQLPSYLENLNSRKNQAHNRVISFSQFPAVIYVSAWNFI